MTKADAADALGVAVRTVESYIQAGLLPGVKRAFLGRRTRTMVRASDVARFKAMHMERD